MKKLFIVLFLGVSYFSGAMAADVLAASDKNYYQFVGNLVTLNSRAPKNSLQLFFIHNISKDSIWLDKANKKGIGMQAGWASQLDSGNWSALLLAGNQANFQLSCANTDMKSLDCSKYIAVSHPSSVTYGAKVTQSSYWVTENQVSDKFLPAIQKRQITIAEKS